MDFLSLVVTLLIVLDPFGNIPMFSSVLSKVPDEARKRILVRELLIALFIMMFFLFFGRPLLEFLHLEASALRLSGGVVLFLIAMGMIFPRKSMFGDEDMEEPFIVPLAVPLLAGPSVLVLIMLMSVKYEATIGVAAAAIGGAWVANSLVLLSGGWFLAKLGKKGMRAIERLMGMILVMVSVQMLLDGVSAFLKSQ